MARIGTLIHQTASAANAPFQATGGVRHREGRRVGFVSDADKLRQVIEVLVSRVQGQIVLQDQSRQPHVVRRNRRALFPELAKQKRVMVGRGTAASIAGELIVHYEKTPDVGLEDV